MSEFPSDLGPAWPANVFKTIANEFVQLLIDDEEIPDKLLPRILRHLDASTVRLDDADVVSPPEEEDSSEAPIFRLLMVHTDHIEALQKRVDMLEAIFTQAAEEAESEDSGCELCERGLNKVLPPPDWDGVSEFELNGQPFAGWCEVQIGMTHWGSLEVADESR